ncbi:MAG: InlB B-repeat-containing protein, partial [Bifidobacterium sp.]|nr:InlB B-repeat-containing protein [Bifidobacterium sp.]
MHLVSRLRRIMAMMTVLISLLAGLGVASAQADAPILTGGGGRQTPRVAKQTPGTLPSNATSTPLPTPSPIQTTPPLNPVSSKPGTPSSTTGTPGSSDSAPAESAEQANNQASHTVRFDPDDGSKPTQSTVQTGALAAPPAKNPVRDGFQFDGWTYNGQPFDFRTPILQDTTLKAQWTKVTDWTLSPNHGPASGTHLTISPPDRQEPYYTSIQSAGNQIVGLTGDGRIYTWTQDSTPKQIPFPAQAADGFHYLQAAADSHRQAALGSDQHVYTWNSGQSTPTILKTSQNTQFTSISLNDDRLLAVDRQGQVHTFQDRRNPKPDGQETTSLPGKAQAVLTVASASRILIVDTDGQAWTWDASNTSNAKPARVKQDPGTRTVQAQALNQGILLLDADGQANYLADSTNSLTAVSLPESTQTSRINSSNDQAIITSKNGYVWAWKPGEAPKRADKGNQQYMQAVESSSMIIAISRQGDLHQWSLDQQGQPGKPARLDTTTAPILESASMNGQALTLSRNNGSWQTDIPARKPGPAVILIAGRKDGQPFTRSLNYTVDQPLTRDEQQGSTYTVHFDTGGGKPEPGDQSVSSPYGRVKRPSPDPARQGFLFDGWFIGEVAYDFSRPVTKDLTLTAKWTPASRNSTWSISPDKGSQLGRESTTITPPDSASRGIRFNQISGGKNYNDGYFSLAVGSDGNAYAWGSNGSGQLGDGTQTRRTTPVRVKTPDRKMYPDLPKDFTYVQVSAGGQHSLALGSDGNAYAWGNNSNGQLGNGTTSYNAQTTPVRVKTPDRNTY